MSWQTKDLARNENNEVVPQYYNQTADDYEVVRGRDGALDVFSKEIGEKSDASVSDGASAGSIIALLKGLQIIVGLVSATPAANTVQDRLKSLADRIGEVAASPSANTLLARLKALEGYLDGVESSLSTIIGHVDGLEATASSQLSELTAIKGNVDGLETTATSQLSELTAIKGFVDGLEGTATSQLSELTAIKGFVDGLEGAIGTATDVAATGNGTLIAVLKQVRLILSDVWVDAANALKTIPVNGAGTEIFTDANPGSLKLTGSLMEYYGATVADRPDANEVLVGAIFMAVDTQEMWQSNGTTWVVV